MFCANCGKQLPDRAVFCSNCGARIVEPIAPAPVAPVAEVPAAAPVVEPVVEAPVAEPVVEVPVTEPIAEVVEDAPVVVEPIVEDVFTASPVPAAPIAPPVVDPVYTPAPVAEPVAEPAYAAPVAEPVADAPVAEPTYVAPVAEPIAEPAYAAPVAKPVAAPVAAPAAPFPMSAKQRGLRKGQFLRTEASTGVKVCSWVALIAFVLVAVVMAFSAITITHSSVFDMPVLTMIVPDEIDEVREQLADDMAAAMENLPEADELEDTLKAHLDEDTAEKLLEIFEEPEEWAENLSVASILSFINIAKEVADVEIPDNDIASELEEVIDTLDSTVVSILNIVQIVVYAYAGLVVLIAFLAAFFKRTGVAVLGLIFALPYCLFLASFLLAGAAFACFVLMMVMTIIVNHAYKAVPSAA